MKITICKAEEEKKPEPEMKLFLVEEEDGINLKAKDANGVEWYIGVFRDNGLALVDSINKDTGWPLDSRGRFKITEY